jgi:hypothetical protein
MNIRDIHGAAGEHLAMDWTLVTPREGRRIDEGEEFDVHLSVRNVFPAESFLAFRDIRLFLDGTRFAEPLGDHEIRIEGLLRPGTATRFAVRFRALEADPLSEGTSKQEPVCRVSARARVVIDGLPEIEAGPKIMTAQIHGGSEPE